MKPLLSCFVIMLLMNGSLVQADMAVQTSFSPRGQCASFLLDAINGAKSEILVAVYAFTSDDLANALIAARGRGVAVRVILDREFDKQAGNSKGKLLAQQKILVRRITGKQSPRREQESGRMHQKFAVVDRKIVFTGSYNWTHSAEAINDENLVVFRDAKPLAEDYRQIFLQLWERKP